MESLQLEMKRWNKYSKEHYLFVLAQAEKKLTATIDTMNSIQSRGRFQLSIGIAITTSLIGWYVSSSKAEFVNVVIFVGIQSLVSVLLASWGIYRYRISALGSSPEDLLDKDFYSPFKNSDDAEKNLILNECLDYADRIERNYTINRRRLKLVTLSFILLATLPVTVLTSWFLCLG